MVKVGIYVYFDKFSVSKVKRVNSGLDSLVFEQAIASPGNDCRNLIVACFDLELFVMTYCHDKQVIINIILITLHCSGICDLLQVREPVGLIIHHMPIAITFAFFGNGDLEVSIST